MEYIRRLTWLLLLAVIVLLFSPSPLAGETESAAGITQILGRPTDRTIALSVLSSQEMECYVEFGLSPQTYTSKTAMKKSRSGEPVEFHLEGLEPNSRHYYRLRFRMPGNNPYQDGAEYSFHTQRAEGTTFVFALQGDSHPERLNRMYDPALYELTMKNVSRDQPDFYITIGDDFSLQPLITRDTLSQENADQIYAEQRGFLSTVGRSASLFLANGNHEEAAPHWLDGTSNNPAVLAGRARTKFFALPAPNGFYSGDPKEVEFVGLLRDYYAWTWGDALFVVIDPYWHSSAPVDSAADKRRGGGSNDRANRPGDGGQQDRRGDRGQQDRSGERDRQDRSGERGQRGQREPDGRERDWWGMGIGDAQYQWLKKTLEESKARYKFVFAHHVLGTGRGGVEMADLYEWGGKNRQGEWEFDKKRPGWEMPIHQLMVKTGVTIFFQGHDHLYAQQERDGVIYQEIPNPADATYQAFNREAYLSGTILPNSGHLRVTVSPENVRVDYVRSYLPKDETDKQKNGLIDVTYTVEGGGGARN